ncbi:MAG: hypothetical protein WCG19_05970 [Chlorobiaceae bacterium]
MNKSIRVIRIAVITGILASNSAYASNSSSLSRAEAKLRTGELNEAIADFTKIIKDNQQLGKSSLVIAYNHRGLAEQAIGDDAAAASDFKKAIELDPTPKDAVAFTERAIAKSAIGDIDGAASDFKQAYFLTGNSDQDG